MIEKGEEPRSSAVKMKIMAKKQTAKEKNGGISRKIKDLRRGVEALLKQKFVKNVVQDLTSGGHEWMRARWAAPIRKYWKISEQMMVKYISQKVSKAYQELKKQYEEGSISKEIMAARMLALREKSEKPEDISIDNVENELDFSPEYYKAYETAIEQNKALLQDKDDLIKKITEKAEFDNKQAEKKIETLEAAAKENKKIQQQLEQQLSAQKEMIQELQKKEKERERRKTIRKNWRKLILKVMMRIILIVLISGGTYWICGKMSWEFGTVISIVIGVAGLFPLVITPIKNDYKKLIKEVE